MEQIETPHPVQSDLEDPNEIIFDAFICYAYEDRPWVEKLVAVLESPPYNLRCCNHDRDFEAGKSTIANIVKHVRASEKFILVLTPSFNESKWCEYERDLILSSSLSKKQRTVIPVVLVKCSIPFNLSSLTYVEATWAFEEAWFDKLTKALNVREIVCSVCHPEGKKLQAKTRCPECKATFCTFCDIQHCRMPISKAHKTAPLWKYHESEETFQDKACEDHVEFQNDNFKVSILYKSKPFAIHRYETTGITGMAASSSLTSLSMDRRSVDIRFGELEARLRALENTGNRDRELTFETNLDYAMEHESVLMQHNTLMKPQGHVSDESQKRTIHLPMGPGSLMDGSQKQVVAIQPLGSDSDDSASDTSDRV